MNGQILIINRVKVAIAEMFYDAEQIGKVKPEIGERLHEYAQYLYGVVHGVQEPEFGVDYHDHVKFNRYHGWVYKMYRGPDPDTGLGHVEVEACYGEFDAATPKEANVIGARMAAKIDGGYFGIWDQNEQVFIGPELPDGDD